jgi:2-(1,2-epoxy-1,2-dihydrophenyl)acetyl-CoA isomerase
VPEVPEVQRGAVFAAQLQLESESFAECAGTDDFVEGVSAFAQKRKPVFNRGG